MFRRALTEQCLHWSSFPTGEAEGAFAGGHEDLLVGEAHGKADGGVEVQPPFSPMNSTQFRSSTPFLPHELHPIPLFTAFPPEANS